MKKGIVDFLYSQKDCDYIRDLYKDDELKPLLQQQIGRKIMESGDTFINGDAIDILAMICLNQNFTSDTRECLSVSLFVVRGMTNPAPIPTVMENRGLDLASKTLVALSFFKPFMVKRWKQHAAPNPSWYRKASQAEFVRAGYTNLAINHRNWEGFLSEHLV
jgi:hypothetical protein